MAVAKASRGKTVRYAGTADIRRITVQDWKNAGVGSESPVAVEWNAANGFVVDSKEFAFLDDDEFAKLVGEDEKLKVEN